MRTLEQILKRYNKAAERQQLWQSTCDEAYQVAMPERNLYNTQTEGQEKSEGVYDSSGIIAANNFVNSMVKLLFPPDTAAAKLSLGPAIVDTDRTEMQDIIDKVNSVLENAVKASNFQVQIVPFLYDLFVGTACLSVQKGDTFRPFIHKAIPNTQIAFEEDAEGNINSVYRLWPIAEEEIKVKWPKATYTNKSSDGTQKINALENIYLDKDTKKWVYTVINKDTKEEIFKYENFNFNSFIVSRWTSIAGEINGRGPLLQAMPEIRFLNRLKYFSSEGLPFRLFPILTTTDQDVLDTDKFVLEPGKINVVARNGGPSGPSVMPLQYGGDVNYEQYQTEEVRFAIKKLTLDTQMPAINGPTKTATEWQERATEIRQDRTIAFGKLQAELIRPLYTNYISILWELGSLPKRFYDIFKVEDINDFILKIDIQSPIARQQDLEDAQQAFNTLQAMLVTDEVATRTTFKLEEMFADIAPILGIKAKYIRTEVERAQLKQQQQQQMTAMQDQDAAREAKKETIINASKQK